MSEKVRIRALVQGQVQGVSFRYFTRREASALGISGFVRNLADGGVELEAQGTKEEVDLLVEAVRGGPPASRVGAVEVESLPLREGEIGFGIRY